jgi:hypothetical protein
MSVNKYECDGHARRIQPTDIQIGLVVRRYASDGGLSCFDDATIIAVDSSNVVLARPYLYADTIFACPNWLIGVERYECSIVSLLSAYSVVETARGALSTFNARSVKSIKGA